MPDSAMILHYNLRNPSYYRSYCVDITLIRVAFVFEEFGALSFLQVLRLLDYLYVSFSLLPMRTGHQAVKNLILNHFDDIHLVNHYSRV